MLLSRVCASTLQKSRSAYVPSTIPGPYSVGAARPRGVLLTGRCCTVCCAQEDALARENLPASSFNSPSASPASQRPQRAPGVKGKPSPGSAEKMPPPPKPKENPASRQRRKSEDGRTTMHADEAGFPTLPLGPRLPGPPRFGLSLQEKLAPSRTPQRSAAPATPQSARPSAWGAPAAVPNLCAAASGSAAMVVEAYSSPLTGGPAEPSSAARPRVTRQASAAAAEGAAAEAAALAERKAALKPHGRVQTPKELSEVEAGQLKWTAGALIDVFVADGSSAATSTELDALDGEG